jgi:hypothetical protein
VGLNIVTVILFLTPSVPPVVRQLITVPNFALENSMACRVFRMLKFDVAALASASNTPAGYGAKLPGSRPARAPEEAESGHGMIIFRNHADAGLSVNVTKDIHVDSQYHSGKRPELEV